jgi:hypothetical protein
MARHATECAAMIQNEGWSEASASGPVSQQVIGGTMLKATGAEETIFKKAAGS